MDYSKAIKAKNVIIQTTAPRWQGRIKRYGEYQQVSPLPFSFADRVALIEKLASENKLVLLKKATVSGHAKIFIVPN